MKSLISTLLIFLTSHTALAIDPLFSCRLNPLFGQSDLKQFRVEISQKDDQVFVEGSFGEKSFSGPVLSVTELALANIQTLLNCKESNRCVWEYLGYSEQNPPEEKDFNKYTVASQVTLVTQLADEFQSLLNDAKKAALENPGDSKLQESYQEILNMVNPLSFDFNKVASAKMYQIDEATKFGTPNLTVYFDAKKQVVGKILYTHALIAGECIDL